MLLLSFEDIKIMQDYCGWCLRDISIQFVASSLLCSLFVGTSCPVFRPHKHIQMVALWFGFGPNLLVGLEPLPRMSGFLEIEDTNKDYTLVCCGKGHGDRSPLVKTIAPNLDIAWQTFWCFACSGGRLWAILRWRRDHKVCAFLWGCGCDKI